MRRTVAAVVAMAVLVAATALAPAVVVASGLDDTETTARLDQSPDNESDDNGLTYATESVGTTEAAGSTTETAGTVENVTGGTGNATDDTDGAVDTTENVTVTTVADGASTPNGSESVGETAGETTGTVGDATGETEVDATTTTATADGETASADTGVSASAGDAVEASASVTKTDPLNASIWSEIDAETAASDDVTGDTTPVGEVAALTAPPDAGDVSASASVETETGTDTTADADGDSDADAGEDADESADAETEPTSEDEAPITGENGESESESRSGSGSGNDDGLPLAGVPTVPLGGRTGAGAAAVVGGLGVTAAATRAWLAGGASTGGAQAAASAAAERSVGGLQSLLDRLRYFIGLGYSRYDDSDPLAHETRARIHESVREEPGVHLSAVAGATDAPLSTVRHHLDVLADEGLVYDADLRGRRRYFPAAETDPALQAALADEATAAVVEALDRLGPASVGDLAEAVDRDRSTLSHHLDRLEDDGVVERERDGRAVVNRLSPAARTTLSEPTVEASADDAGHVGEGAYVPSDD